MPQRSRRRRPHPPTSSRPATSSRQRLTSAGRSRQVSSCKALIWSPLRCESRHVAEVATTQHQELPQPPRWNCCTNPGYNRMRWHHKHLRSQHTPPENKKDLWACRGLKTQYCRNTLQRPLGPPGLNTPPYSSRRRAIRPRALHRSGVIGGIAIGGIADARLRLSKLPAHGDGRQSAVLCRVMLGVACDPVRGTSLRRSTAWTLIWHVRDGQVTLTLLARG